MKDFKDRKVFLEGTIIKDEIFVRGFFLTPQKTIKLARWMLEAAHYINQIKKENTMAKKKAAKSKKKSKK